MHGDLANYLGIYPVQQVPPVFATQTIDLSGEGIASAEDFGVLAIAFKTLEVVYLAVTRRLQGLRGR